MPGWRKRVNNNTRKHVEKTLKRQKICPFAIYCGHMLLLDGLIFTNVFVGSALTLSFVLCTFNQALLSGFVSCAFS